MLNILLIEDHPDIAEMMSDVLSLLGHRVTWAETGVDGLAAARRLNPDLILLDIGLPDISGYQLAPMLRSIRRDFYVAAITGWGTMIDRSRSRVAGIDEHLVKPVPIAAMRALCSRVVGRAGVEPVAALVSA